MEPDWTAIPNIQSRKQLESRSLQGAEWYLPQLMSAQNLKMWPHLEMGSLQITTKGKSEMRSCWSRVGCKSNDCPLMRQAKRHRGEGHAKTEAEMGVMLPGAKDCQELLETTRGKEGCPLTSSGQAPPRGWVLTSGLQKGNRIHFCSFI